MSAPRVIAEVTSAQGWAGLLDGLRRAFDDLNTSYRALNDLAGLQEGYAEKLLGPNPLKGIGRTTFGPLIGALGVKILIVVDEPARASLRAHSRYQKRRIDAPSRHTSKKISAAQRRRRKQKLLPPERARYLQGLQTLRMTPAQRSASARHAAKMRWKKPRLIEIKADSKVECVDQNLDKNQSCARR